MVAPFRVVSLDIKTVQFGGQILENVFDTGKAVLDAINLFLTTIEVVESAPSSGAVQNRVLQDRIKQQKRRTTHPIYGSSVFVPFGSGPSLHMLRG